MQKYKFINFILIPILFFILVFLLVSVPSFAASEHSYFPFVQNNDNIPTTVYNKVISDYPLDDYYVFVSSIGYYSWGDTNYPFFAISKQYDYPYATISQDGYHFSFYNGSSGVYGECRVQGNGTLTLNTGLNISYNPYFQNLVSPLYDPTISYFLNFDLYTDSSESVAVAFVTAPITVPDAGHANSPSNNLPTISYPIGMHPTSAPTVPTYSTPSLSTAPSIDTTNINTLVQSIFNLLSWMLQSFVVYIVNFISTVVDWFEFLSNLIIWLFKSFIDWLNAFTDWLYNIFKYLFEPIFTFLSSFFGFLFSEDDQMSVYDLLKEFKEDFSTRMSNLFSSSFFSNYWTNFYNYIVSSFDVILNAFSKIIVVFAWLYNHGLDSSNEFSLIVLINYLLIPDSSQFQAAIINHDQYGFISSFTHLADVIGGLYDDLNSLSPSYKLTLRSFTLCGVIVPDTDIDFSWYLQYKTVGDGIISAFLIFGYSYWLFIRFNGILRGTASDVSQSVTEVKKL